MYMYKNNKFGKQNSSLCVSANPENMRKRCSYSRYLRIYDVMRDTRILALSPVVPQRSCVVSRQILGLALYTH